MRDALQSYHSRDGECVVIRNGRDPCLFAPAAKSELIFASGRVWDEAKNLQLLDQVAREIEWPIVLAGDCQHPEGWAVGFQNVLCLGKLSPNEMAQQFSRAAIFILPACYEPFGLAALEAALSGCALVLGDIPSLREIWGDTAIFVSPTEANALSRALTDLIADPQRRQNLGSRAHARALHFSPQRMAQEYLGAYRRCMNHNAPLIIKTPQLAEEVAA